MATIWFSDLRNRHLRSFFILGLIVSLWVELNGLSLIIGEQYYSIFYLLRMILVCSLPYSLLMFCLFFAGSKLVEAKLLRLAVIIIPGVDILAMFTNPLHGLYFLETAGQKFGKGPLFWVHTGISYFVILAGFVFLFKFIFHLAKKNKIVLLASLSIMIPWVVNIIYTFSAPSQSSLNLTPVLFCVILFAFFFTSYKSHLFDIKKSMLTRIFESYRDAIVLVGEDGIIQDYNESFIVKLPSFKLDAGKTKFADFIQYIKAKSREINPPNLFDILESDAFAAGEFSILWGRKLQSFQVDRQWFETKRDNKRSSRRKKHAGYSISFHDITKSREQDRHLLELKVAAEAASEAKSNFLANTSHEIRTPLNAIMGIAELLLRKDIAPDIYESILSIKQAGVNLLAIINDILDISKIESGKMEIHLDDYRFTFLINECIDLIQVRIADKRLRFIANIDSTIPDLLVGDHARIRQILLNLLSNAVKYTNEGYIKLSAHSEVCPVKQDGTLEVMLFFEITDTGIGIKPEDVDKLFTDFTRIDSHRNLGIEGTGLGLAISRNLCRLMGGTIEVVSQYGKGSIFTVKLPQRVRDQVPIARVQGPESKPVLVYERRSIYEESLVYSLRNLGVPVSVAKSDRLKEELAAGNWSFVFVSPDAGKWIPKFIKEKEFNTVMVLLGKPRETAAFENISEMTIPAYTAPIANVLNGIREVKIHREMSSRFMAPDAKVLVVDDITTNLFVARGLLALYRITVETCTTGRKALELVRDNHYDIIFMDHMMPEMDGIETTAAIRAWEEKQQGKTNSRRQIPIIALTANAVSGMKEMFLSKKFNDFISKPIEGKELEDALIKWLPEEKQIRSDTKKTKNIGEVARMDQQKPEFKNQEPKNANLSSPDALMEELSACGVDVEQGIDLTGGDREGYFKVLSIFYTDIEERLGVFEKLPGKEDLLFFATQAHAMKSAAATIGALDISKKALELETAGKAGDLEAIAKLLKPFRERLERLVNVAKRIPTKTLEETAGGGNENLNRFLPRLKDLKTALEHENIGSIDHILEELEKIPFDVKTAETLSVVSNAVLISEFKEALQALNELLGA
jgi:signal transduction histidine kinase/CheY-like chemotaxis protein/HPt (histidine-containing phosphotransfer) domain-containing protein